MEIGKKFSSLTLKEYFYFIENHRKFADFNRLGLYRSILENEKLTVSDKIAVRDYANRFSPKFFDFLQIKDPYAYFGLVTLGESLTKADEARLWREIRSNQEKILKDKKIRHRNFGIYSRHSCGDENCYLNGLMIEQGSYFAEFEMRFESDRNKNETRGKAERTKKGRRTEKQTIDALLADET